MTPSEYLAEWPEGESRNTKHVAADLSITTAKAYAMLCAFEKAGAVSKYGYRVRGGWESPEHSTRHAAGLYWQRN